MGTGNGRGLKRNLDDGGKTRVYGWIRKLLSSAKQGFYLGTNQGKRRETAGTQLRSVSFSRGIIPLDNYYFFHQVVCNFLWYLMLVSHTYNTIHTHNIINTPSTESDFSFLNFNFYMVNFSKNPLSLPMGWFS